MNTGQQSEVTDRDAAVEHLRIGLTALVILHHTAIVYGGSGGWYWREETNASSKLLLMFNAVNQSFFMGLFFLLAGYYTPASYLRKGPKQFLKDRWMRLGIPWIVFLLLISPLTVAWARSRSLSDFPSQIGRAIRNWDMGPGPLWFVQALFLFSIGYVVWKWMWPKMYSLKSWPGNVVVVAAALLTGVISFVVRLFVPVGSEVLALQLGYFPAYLLLFGVGCGLSGTPLLSEVQRDQMRLWLKVTAAGIVLLPLFIFFRSNAGTFEGGFNLNALFYAFWDPLICWGIILGLLWWFHLKLTALNPVTRWLAQNAYAAFIVHAPVVVILSKGAMSLQIFPLLKFVFIGTISVALSFCIGALIRSFPGPRRIL